MTAHSVLSMTHVADGVVFVEGPASNWVILSGDGTVTLIDTGYPNDIGLVRASLLEADDGAALAPIAITHGHADHIGGVKGLLRDAPNARVLTGDVELPNVRRDVTHQVTARDVFPHLVKPRFARWLRHAVRAGGLEDVAVPNPEGLTDGAEYVFSGHRVRARITPGHTPGHTVFELLDHHAVATGDSIVTGHAVSRITGSQCLHPIFHHDAAQATGTAQRLAREWAGWTLLPGHGPLLCP